MNTKSSIFTSGKWKKQVLVFMSEIKFDLTLQNINISFMFLFTIVKLLPILRLSSWKSIFFLAILRQFGLVQRV